jgi:hypothetical protein
MRKDPPSLQGTVNSIMSVVLLALTPEEQLVWDNQPPDDMKHRLSVMAAWIDKRRHNPPLDKHNVVLFHDITEAMVLAAYRATIDLVTHVTWVPSREKKWAAKGRPEFRWSYSDGSEFDWDR